ncbi:hypothetical protein [Microbacterium abyssi]|uniref:hypothetical protein n=1 Tax=Microbacterium abyssi TaxID=2782166 RepID=UPI0018890F88|nr:hypothetical protein [Microbacterium sp. A18JL241]
MRVLLGWTLLLGFVGAILLFVTAEHARSAWPWVRGADWGGQVVLAVIVALAAGIALSALAGAWAREMDAFRVPRIAVACAFLALLASFGVWSAFSFWIVNLNGSGAAMPSESEGRVAAIWFIGAWFIATVLWLAFLVWDYARWRVLQGVQRREPTTPGLRSFDGAIVTVPGEPMLRDPLHGSACVSWRIDGTTQENWEESAADRGVSTGYLEGRWMPGLANSDEHAGFDGEASEFYVLVGDAFIRVQPDGVEMRGRPGVKATIDTIRLADRALSEHARALGVRQIRTRLLTVGDPVVVTGVITVDADGGFTLQAKPDGDHPGALVPRASVRVRP